MAYDQALADRIKDSLTGQKKVEGKKMFSGICFMVDGKMCICVSGQDLMCRIGPAHFENAIKQEGVRPMVMRNKVMEGFVYVSRDVLGTKKQLDYWIGLCLDFNKVAKASKTKSRTAASKKKA
jgi:hypothetical protein